jgi:tRNA(Ile)-lysidine synthase
LPKLPKNLNFDALKSSKNLLAFSGGVDSSALFFMLVEAGVEFDMAIVDYNVRASSKDEIAYAQELSSRYKKRLFEKAVNIKAANFEAEARRVRYEFFEDIVKQNGYDTLLFAHHLGDRLEWFLMRFVRGAGAVELCGFEQVEKRDGYRIVRPLLECVKEELLEFLTKNGHKYFIDESNFDEKYERNRFRKYFSEPLLREHKEGILRSFKALLNDKEKLFPKEYERIDSLYFFKRDENEIRLISKISKFFKIVLSSKQRDEIEKLNECVISGKIAIGKNDDFVFIAPFEQDVVMSKEFKESCRKAKLPKNIRGYMFAQNISPKDML